MRVHRGEASWTRPRGPAAAHTQESRCGQARDEPAERHLRGHWSLLQSSCCSCCEIGACVRVKSPGPGFGRLAEDLGQVLTSDRGRGRAGGGLGSTSGVELLGCMKNPSIPEGSPSGARRKFNRETEVQQRGWSLVGLGVRNQSCGTGQDPQDRPFLPQNTGSV